MSDIILFWFDGDNERTKEFNTIKEAEEYRTKHILEMVDSAIYKKVSKCYI